MGCCKLKPESAEKETAKQTVATDTDHVIHKSTMYNFVNTVSGSVTQDYEIIRLIGEGGYGQVKEVRENSTGIKRACKSISLKFMKNKEIENIFQEIKVLKSLDHPGIIKIFQVYREPTHIHIITELCTGGELFDKITKNSRLTENLAAKYMFDIVSTVKYLHEAGYMHRDLKPDNIVFDIYGSAGRLKIIDFGTSIPVEKEILCSAVVGTPYYIAPEVLRGEYSKECDIWSIGVILYIMLCGNPPFNGRSNKEIYDQILEDSPKFDSFIWESISKSAKALIKKALNKDPKKRLTISEFFYDPWIRTRSKDLIPEKELSVKSLENLSKFKNINKLQACTFVFLSQSFATSLELKHVRELFESFDKNGDGKLSIDEIKAGVKQYSGDLIISAEEIMKNCDLDQNGFLDYSEFLAGVSMQNMQVSKEKLKCAFDAIDLDGNGKITKNELRQALVGMTNEKAVIELLTEIDKNGDGQIDLDEFVDAILNSGVNKV